MDLEGIIAEETGRALKGESDKKAASGSVPDVLEGAALDIVAENLMPAKKDDPAREAKDAKNADTAFTAILLALEAAANEAWATIATPISVASLGTFAPTQAGVHSAITAAGIAVKIAWSNLSTGDKARIWRGEA